MILGSGTSPARRAEREKGMAVVDVFVSHAGRDRPWAAQLGGWDASVWHSRAWSMATRSCGSEARVLNKLMTLLAAPKAWPSAAASFALAAWSCVTASLRLLKVGPSAWHIDLAQLRVEGCDSAGGLALTPGGDGSVGDAPGASLALLAQPAIVNPAATTSTASGRGSTTPRVTFMICFINAPVLSVTGFPGGRLDADTTGFPVACGLTSARVRDQVAAPR